MLTLRQIEIFRAVMIARSVSGAARALGTSQPGLSRALGHMQDRIGFRLFERVRGRLIPTTEAAALFDETQRLHKAIDGIGQVITRLASGVGQTLRIGASPSLGHSVIPPMLSRLLGAVPAIDVRFDVLSVEQVVDWLELQRGDYAFTVYPLDHPGIESRCIGRGRMSCVLPAGHRLATAARIGIADLAGERLVGFDGDSPHGRLVGAIHARAGLVATPAVTVRFAETAVVFVGAGLGVAIVDDFTARQPHGDAVRFVPLIDDDALPVFLHSNPAAPRSAAGERLVAVATAVLRDLDLGP